MSELKNFVAVDWRSGKDRIYFFFKDSNKYTRFNINDNKVPAGYPRAVTPDNWDSFHCHVKNLRFGFTTTGVAPDDQSGSDDDILWLFYTDESGPMVCKYDQDLDKVRSTCPIEQTIWAILTPYFNQIVAGTWWEMPGFKSQIFRFLMNDGNTLALNIAKNRFMREKIDEKSWPGLEPYKHRIITAAQNDRTLADSYYYIFLTGNQYIRYNIRLNQIDGGPIDVDETSWPGLLNDGL